MTEHREKWFGRSLDEWLCDTIESPHGRGIAATRLGVFSIGTAVERVTEWMPGRVLAFTVLSQPAAMVEEMRPYCHLHSPHLTGYVVTGESKYPPSPLRHGGTRLTF